MDLPLLLTALCSLDGVLPMIPSEAAVLAAGVFAQANVVTVVLAAALGVFTGDHLAYGLARSVVGPESSAGRRRPPAPSRRWPAPTPVS